MGKRLTGIRVVEVDGTPLGAGTVLVRQTLLQWILGSVVTLVAFLDYVWPLFDRENRALHDHVVRTRVVRDS